MPATLEEITNAMTEAVESDGRLKKRFNAVVLFVVQGETYTLDARADTTTTPLQTPDLTITTSLATLLDLLDRKMTPQQAFLKGKLKIKGKMSLGMKLAMILDATRKRLALQNARL